MCIRDRSVSRVLVAFCGTRNCAFLFKLPPHHRVSLQRRLRSSRRKTTLPPEREGSWCLPSARFEPRGSIVLNVPLTRCGGLPSVVRCGAHCRAAGLSTGERYPAIGSQTRRTSHAAADSHFIFPQAGQINVTRLRQAQTIAKQGEEEERRDYTPLSGTYHELKRLVNAGRQVTSRPRSVSLKEVSELHGVP